MARAPGRVERLSIAVLVPPTLAPAEMERLRKLVTAAAGLDTERGDRLEVTAIAALTAETDPVRSNPVLNPERPLRAEDGEIEQSTVTVTHTPLLWWLLVLTAGLLLGWLLAIVLRSSPPKLRADEREAVLAKLRSWLAEGGSAA